MRVRLGDEAGQTLVELLVVCVLLVIIVGGLAQLFTGALNSQSEQTSRAAAQQTARVALDRLRRQIHCASSASSTTSNQVTVALPASCSSSGSAVTETWCAVGSGAPYVLTVYSGSSCSGTGTALVDSLASNAVFTVTGSGSVSSTLSADVVLPASSIPVASVAAFPSGTNVVSVGSSPTSVTCTGTDSVSNSLTGCSGGSGSYTSGTWVWLSGQHRATVNVSLVGRSSSTPYRQFTLTDSIELRNS